MNWWAATTALLVLTNGEPPSDQEMMGFDVSNDKRQTAKAAMLRGDESADLTVVLQVDQLRNPDARVMNTEESGGSWLNDIADYGKGSTTGDGARFIHSFWEHPKFKSSFSPWLNSPKAGSPWSGRSDVCVARVDDESLTSQLGCRIHGQVVWGRSGVAVNKMRGLEPFIYSGELFDDNVCPICPKNAAQLSSLWAYVSSDAYRIKVRDIDQAVKVTAATLTKVPFDPAHWQKVAAEKCPHGLPKPFSNDPTQWLFNGHPSGADQPLHVAVARLLGYQWPRQTGSSFPDCPALVPDGLETLADADGIVPISPAKGEGLAADRLRELLVSAYGKDWNVTRQEALLAQVGYAGASLEDWLRNGFFEQHNALFHHRPFIWHVWDGLKNGFSALVNYHKLTHASLEKLTYSTLGNWIQRQQAGVTAGAAGSDAKLQAAKQLQAKLKLILDGEPPYDIFVRWKPLAQQPIGWHPDLNDGMRMNIRPFATADILRKRVKIKWEKDRGKEPVRSKAEFPWFWGWDEVKQDFAGVGKEPDGNRWNNCHYSIAVKQAAQAARK